MESRVNYVRVGIFVTVFIVGLLGFAFWLMKFGTQEKYDTYLIYMQESVAGLSKDSAVKYMGVDAGVVETIVINPKNTGQVEVYVKIEQSIPIKEDMLASLKFYGLTGLAYLEIRGIDNNSPLLTSKNGKIAVIKSAPSTYARLDESLTYLASQLSTAFESMEKLLNEKNLANIENSLANISQITHNFKAIKATRIIENIKNSFAKLNTIMANAAYSIKDEAKGAFDQFEKASLSMQTLMQDLDKTLKRGDYNINNIAEPTMGQLNELLLEVQSLATQMQNAVKSIQESPSDLLFKKKEQKLGPGER